MATKSEIQLFKTFLFSKITSGQAAEFRGTLTKDGSIADEYYIEQNALSFITNAFDWKDTPSGDLGWYKINLKWNNWYTRQKCKHKDVKFQQPIAGKCQSIW